MSLYQLLCCNTGQLVRAFIGLTTNAEQLLVLLSKLWCGWWRTEMRSASSLNVHHALTLPRRLECNWMARVGRGVTLRKTTSRNSFNNKSLVRERLWLLRDTSVVFLVKLGTLVERHQKSGNRSRHFSAGQGSDSELRGVWVNSPCPRNKDTTAALCYVITYSETTHQLLVITSVCACVECVLAVIIYLLPLLGTWFVAVKVLIGVTDGYKCPSVRTSVRLTVCLTVVQVI